MINWKVRFANETFWLDIIPAVLILIQLVLDLFGIKMDFGSLGNKLRAIVNAVFMCLAILGIVTDHTTHGIGDSARALTYETPYKDIPDVE